MIMLKRRYNLEKTWRLCMSLWRWVAKQKGGGSRKSVPVLKEEWLRKKGIEGILYTCFFCDYDGRIDDECDECPGRSVDLDFDCEDDEYYWKGSPIAFYNKLVSLNRKRKGKK